MGLLEVAGPTSALLAPALAMVTTASPRKAVSTHVPTFSASYGTSPHCLCKVGRRENSEDLFIGCRQADNIVMTHHGPTDSERAMEPWSLTNVGGLLHIIDLRFDHCLAAQTEKGRCWYFDASGVFC